MVDQPSPDVAGPTSEQATPRSMSDEKCGRSLRPMPHLPLEILQRIGQDLNLASAKSLALTCVNLRDAGESRIWETLDITTDWDEVPAIHYAQRRPPNEREFARAAIIDSKLRHALRALSLHPFRASCVRRIRIEASDGEDGERAIALFNLVQRFSAQVTQLDLVPRYVHPSDDDHLHCDYFLHLFIPIPSSLTFSRLKSVRYVRTRDDFSPIDIWLTSLPHLEALHIQSKQLEFVPYVSYLQHEESHRQLLNLRQLTFTSIGDANGRKYHSHDLLADFLGAAPNLEILHLSGSWRPRDGDTPLAAMANCRKLRTILFSHEGDWATINISLPGVRYWRVGKVNLAAELMVVQIDSLAKKHRWRDNYAFQLNNIRLPVSKHLKRLTILTDYEHLGTPIPLLPTPRDIGSMPDGIIGQLSLSPHTTILAFARYTDSLSFPLPHQADSTFLIPPSEWEARGLYGTIIRQYVHPNIVGEKLWHLRSLYPYEPSNRASSTPQRAWQDHTLYQGEIVPRNILEQVYRVSGQVVASLDGGRNLPLGQGDAGWAVLREWRTQPGLKPIPEIRVSDDDGKGWESADDEYDSDGYDENGRDEEGYDREGRGDDGFDREGYDRHGYDIKENDRGGFGLHDGLNDEGWDKDGYNIMGYNEDGDHRDGEVEYASGDWDEEEPFWG